MAHSVALDHLPEGFRFPADHHDRIEYDPRARRLTFHGFMSKDEFDRLSRLHDDWSYRRPLEELFRLCTVSEPPRMKGWWRRIARS